MSFDPAQIMAGRLYLMALNIRVNQLVQVTPSSAAQNNLAISGDRQSLHLA